VSIEETVRDAAKRPGRPRSEAAEQALLDAALAAVSECGVEGVRCEDVATRAGVGKATLYRRWPGKEDLLIAAFASLKSPLPSPRGTSVREDLIAMLALIGTVLAREKHEATPAEAGFAERVVDEILQGIAVR
jgi:AcrR family transcriptional regulator